jgi:hypothetical protein
VPAFALLIQIGKRISTRGKGSTIDYYLRAERKKKEIGKTFYWKSFGKVWKSLLKRFGNFC